MVGKAAAAVVLFPQLTLLNHRTHGTVEYQDALCGGFFQRDSAVLLPVAAELLLDGAYDLCHLAVGIVHDVCRVQVTAVFKLLDYLHGLFHLVLVVEVHLQMDTVAADVV